MTIHLNVFYASSLTFLFLLALRSFFISADQELCVVGMSMTENDTTRETGTSEMFADFDSMWGSPIDFDDLSGAYGDEGKKTSIASVKHYVVDMGYDCSICRGRGLPQG